MNKLMVAVVAGVVAFGAQAEAEFGAECIPNGTFESDDMSAWKASRTTNNNNDWAVKATGLQGSYCIYIWQTSSATCTFIAPEGGKYAFSMLSAQRGASYGLQAGHWTAVSIDDQEPFLNFQDNSLAAQLREAEITLTKGEHVLKLKGSIEGTKDQSSVYDNISLKFLLPDTAIEPPTYSPYSVIFNGENQCVTFSSVEHLVFGGVTNATEVGKHEFTLTPEEGYTWSDFTTDTKTFYWEILAVQNGWTTVPSVSRTRYVVGDAVTVSAGEPKFGETVATLDGEPFDPSMDALPQEPGEYTLVFTVPAGESYSSLYYAFNLIVSGSESSGEIGTRSLPSEYLPLDYISSESSFGSSGGANGGAYIQLDFPLESTDRIEARVMFGDTGGAGTVFCSRTDTSDTDASESYVLLCVNAGWRLNYGATIATSSGTVDKDKVYDVVIDAGTMTLSTQAEPVYEYETKAFTGGCDTTLFACRTAASATANNFAKMRMYYFYVFDTAGEVTHELVPAKRTSDSVVGLYDLCTDKFWSSANATRAFNAPAYKDADFLSRLVNSPNRASTSPYASGGDVILYDGNTYAHIFTNTANPSVFALVKDMPQANILVIGGGGGGGNRGGGGGAGGYVEAKDISLAGGEYGIVVGAGGTAGYRNQWNQLVNGGKGGDSVVTNALGDLYRAVGGGYGASGEGSGTVGGSGASGGGGHASGGAAEAGQGYPGGSSSGAAAGGGGGAGAPGNNASGNGSVSGVAGGIGKASMILGFEQYFAGGGGTSGQNGNGGGGAGGKGGGGAGSGYNVAGKPGANGLGGGGAGGGGNSNFQYFDGGRGGDGIVIIAYQTAGVPKPVGGKIARPTAIPGLVYNGSDQMGVAEGAGYTITGHFAALGGDHTATATLEEGFEWSDGSTEPAEIVWFIAAAENDWTTAPAIATQHYGKDQAGDVALTAGVARYGEVVATIAKDGGEPSAFGGALPAVPGAYELTYFVDADPSWTGLTNKLTFTVYPFEIKPWANSFIADLTTNANRVVSSEFAEGGDMVLKYPGKDGARDTYVHVFTDTSADSVFTVAAGKRLADAEILVVGGGGGAGNGSHNGWTFYCAGGGDGGDVVVTNGLLIAKKFLVHVGKGGTGGGGAGGESSFVSKNGAVSVVAQGGQGGLSNNSETDGAPSTGNGGAGQPNGGGGADANGHDGVMATTLGYEQYFGGGGAGGTHSVNGGGTYHANGGKGGGGASQSDTYGDKYGEVGIAGLGGGGAGGWMQGGLQDSAGRAGGSGIVAIRYSKVSSAGLLLFVK